VFSKIRRRSLQDIILDLVIYLSLIFLIIVTLYPFLNTLAVSLNNAMDSIRGGIYLWPREFTLFNYKEMLGRDQMYHAALISVLRTVIITGLGTFFTAMLAYIISRKDFVLRKPLTYLYVMTMYLNAGIIPTYFVYRSLGLTNSFWVYIWPGMIQAFLLLILRTYIHGLPESLVESARIDGASEFTIFMRIIMPLCKPVLATVAIFLAVWNWNAWFDTFLYNSSNPALSTLQYELMKVLKTANSMSGSMAQGISQAANGQNTITPTAIRATMTIIVTVPIALVYPFLQKYFVQGLTLGGVKE
jgi:putative aldouronate transport system permease protein